VFLVRACGVPESEFKSLQRDWEALVQELMWLQCEQLAAHSPWLDKGCACRARSGGKSSAQHCEGLLLFLGQSSPAPVVTAQVLG